MSAEPYTLDANVLFYAIDKEAGQKHRVAFSLVQAATSQPRCVLCVQALAETYNAIVKRRPAVVQRAGALLTQAQDFINIVGSTQEDFLEAMGVHEERPVHFWDMMLLATAKRVGCTTILTEDVQDRPSMGGVRYLNPFTATSHELAPFLP